MPCLKGCRLPSGLRLGGEAVDLENLVEFQAPGQGGTAWDVRAHCQTLWVQGLALPPSSSVAFSKFHNLSGPQSPPCPKRESSNSLDLVGVWMDSRLANT